MRIQKFLRSQGLGSLRKCDELVSHGHVRVNGRKLKDPTCYLKTGDEITVSDKSYVYQADTEKHIYLMFNKPREVLSSHNDPEGRPLIFDYLPNQYREYRKRLSFAGRLDFMSRGLMLLSTDGAFIQEMSHPSNEHEKEYLVRTSRDIDKAVLSHLSTGFTYKDEDYRDFKFQLISAKEVKIIVHEGKKHLVRNIIHAADNKVTDLKRTRIGEYQLGELKEGSFKSFEL